MDQPLWRALFALAFAALAFVYLPTLETLHKRWSELSHSYSHGYLLLVVAAYVIWQERGRIAAPWRPLAWLAVPLLIGASLFWFAGFATQLTLAQQLAIPAIVWCCLVISLGWRAGWWLVLPVGLIYFGVPVWDFLVEPLQHITVVVTQTLLFQFRIPAFVHGFDIEVPSGTFEVAGGCSGLNYLLVGIVIGILHAYLNLRSWPRRIAAVLLVIALAFLSNWIRVFALVLIGYYTEMQSEMIDDHDGFGWFVFAGALVLFFLLSRWLLEGGAAPARPVSGAINWRLAAGRAWIAVALAAALPLWSYSFNARVDTAEAGLPSPQGAPWVGATPSWTADYVGFDAQQSWRTRLQGRAAELVALTWMSQEQDRKLIYYRNRLAERRNLVAELEPAVIGEIRVNRAVVRSGAGTRMVWWFYLVGDATATGALESKLKQLPAYLSGDTRAALITLSISCTSRRCEAEQQDEALAQGAGELLDGALVSWRSDPA